MYSLTHSTYPYVMTENGEALVFNYQYKQTPESKLDEKETPATGFTLKLSDKR
mgnify:CR=1 FL=1